MSAILLQSDFGASVLKALLDQALSLGLLGFVAYTLYKRLRQVEDKMEKYQTEDRKEMTHVIQNNTNVMAQSTQVMEKNARIMHRLEVMLEEKEK